MSVTIPDLVCDCDRHWTKVLWDCCHRPKPVDLCVLNIPFAVSCSQTQKSQNYTTLTITYHTMVMYNNKAMLSQGTLCDAAVSYEPPSGCFSNCYIHSTYLIARGRL